MARQAMTKEDLSYNSSDDTSCTATRRRAFKDTDEDRSEQGDVVKGRLQIQERDVIAHMQFRDYGEAGGIWSVACCDPDEDDESTAVLLGRGDEISGRAEFWDDTSGKPLNAEKVREARVKEMRELDRMVGKEPDLVECWEKKSRGPVGVR